MTVRGPGRDTLHLDPDQAAKLQQKLRDGSSNENGDLRWHLESAVDGGEIQKIPIGTLPFRIGRSPEIELTLPSGTVSKQHAEIYGEPGGLRVRDLGSTNGTYLNGKPLTDSALREGDVLSLADFEFRVGTPTLEEPVPGDPGRDPRTIVSGRSQATGRFVPGTRELKELLQQGAVTMVFQPIVFLQGRGVAACEALGRGTHPGLPNTPIELFKIAETMGTEAELSRLFRRKAVEQSRVRADMPTLFLNTHPSELSQPGLLESLEELRRLAPPQDLALEIHESVLTQPSVLAELRNLLSESNIGLAYDDFGAGQSRLLELAEAPPHYLKFDRRFVTGIDQPDQVNRRRLVSALVSLANDLLVKTLAEGVETEGEAEACRSLGITYGQGYYFGRPVPIEQFP